MATKRPRIEIPEEEIAFFCKKWNVAELSFFGSVMRDDFGPDSDIDVMVKFKLDGCPSLFGIVDMKFELEEILGRPVDLIEEGTIRNPFRRQSIMRDLTVVYAA